MKLRVVRGHVKMSAAAFSQERDKVGGQERSPVAVFYKGRLHANRTSSLLSCLTGVCSAGSLSLER